MSEERQITGLVAGCLILGIIGIVAVTIIPPLFEGDLVVDRYTAVLEGNGTLFENYVYDVKNSGEYHMLYRSWEEPVTLTDASVASIRSISLQVPDGTVGYVKDNNGDVTTTAAGDSTTTSAIDSLAYDNEVGIYKASSFSAGTYTVEYIYLLHPPVEYDDHYTHLNLQLAGSSHIAYRNVRISVPSQNIDQVYAYPASLAVTEDNGWFVITGSLAEDQVLAVEMVGGTDAFSGIPAIRSAVGDVKGKAASAAFWYNLPYYASLALNGIAKVAVILIPLLLFWTYRRYGREKEFGVPAYLSTTPNTAMKPWQVNLLFAGDALDFDENGYYATLLDLHRRKLIRITEKPEGKGVEIQVLSNTSPDPYEQRVLNFIGAISENGVLDTTRIETLAKEAQSNRSSEETALRYQKLLSDVTSRADAALPQRYIVDGREHVIPYLLSAIVLFGISLVSAIVLTDQGSLLWPAVLLGAVALVQAVAAFSMPSTLFGHWKDDRYKEKLEWDSFAHFLSDMAMIRRYSPADISLWGEWLVYGTALGVGDKVEQAMKNLNISIPETGVPLGVVGMNYAFLPLMHFTPPSHGGSGHGGFGGGGFGGGDGFGGGGAGGR